MALRLRRGTDTQRALITPAEGELIYVTDTNEIYVGDGTTVGGIRITGEVVNQLGQLNDVDAALPQDGDLLVYDSPTGDWVAGELPLDDLSNVNTTGIVDGQVLVWDEIAQAFVPGNNASSDAFVGDITGSVYSDASGLMVDAINERLIGSLFSGNGDNDIIIDTSRETGGVYLGGYIQNDVNRVANGLVGGGRPQLRMTHIKNPADNNLNSLQGNIHFDAQTDDGTITHTAYMAGGTLGFFFVNDYNLDGSFGVDNTTVINANGIGFKTYDPQEALDIDGNGQFTGNVSAASFTGSLNSDDSTIIIDAIDGSISAQSFVQFGSLTTTERNALTAANGMVIYNTTDNKFQGYENGAWVNLV